MSYQLLNFIPPNPDVCFCKSRPTAGAYAPVHRSTRGEPIADRYPDDPFEVQMELNPDWSGVQLASFLGNTGSLVIVHRDVSNFIDEHLDTGPTEVLPFTLLNHKGRTHSRDYVFFNPVGTYDCLDLTLSDVQYRDDGSVRRVRTPVLDQRLLDDAPDVLRIRHAPSKVLLSPRAIEAFEDRGFTNFEFEEIDVRLPTRQT